MAGLGARYAILLAPLRYGAAFGKGRLRVEAYIDTGEKERTKEIFDKLCKLCEKRQEIEQSISEELEWNSIDDKRASRISLYYPDEIRLTEEARAWLVEAMGKMRDAFDPVLKDFRD